MADDFRQHLPHCLGLPAGVITGALEARMLLIKFIKSFADNPDLGLDDRLAPELPGIALWALEGLKRLRKSGWTAPGNAVEERKGFRRDSSAALAFLQDRCAIKREWLTSFLPDVEGRDGDLMTTNDEMQKAFWDWTQETGKETRFEWFARDVRALLPNLPATNPKKWVKGKQVRYYPGITLR